MKVCTCLVAYSVRRTGRARTASDLPYGTAKERMMFVHRKVSEKCHGTKNVKTLKTTVKVINFTRSPHRFITDDEIPVPTLHGVPDSQTI